MIFLAPFVVLAIIFVVADMFFYEPEIYSNAVKRNITQEQNQSQEDTKVKSYFEKYIQN